MVYPALLPLMCTPRLPVVDWTKAPADLNGLVHFAGRQNLVSARLPSHFKSSLTPPTFPVWIWSKYKFKSMFLPNRNHHVFITKTIWFSPFRELVAAYCENVTNTNTLCGWNEIFLKVEAGCRSSAYPITLKRQIIIIHFLGGYRCPIFKCLISDGCSLPGAISCAPGRKPLFF